MTSESSRVTAQARKGEAQQHGLPEASHHRLSRQSLRWVTVLVPTAAFTFLVVFHPHTLPLAAHIILALGVTACAAFFFSRFVFFNIQRQEEAIIQRNKELAALNTVGKILSQSLKLDEVLPRALETILEVTRLEAGEIFLWEEETQEMVLQSHRGRFPEGFRKIARFKRGEGFPGHSATSGEPIVVHDLAHDPRFLRAVEPARGFCSVACVSLRAKDKVLGVLEVASFSPQRPAEEDMRILTAIGHELGMAIENFQLSQQLEAMAVVRERERIAQELHDSLAQDLALLHLKVVQAELALRGNGAPEVRENLKEMRQIAGGAYDDIRQAIFGLRTMISKGMGLIPTLVEYLHDFSELRKMSVDLSLDGAENLRLSPQMEIQLIRIIHEALTNIFKHAQATKSRVKFELDGEFAKVTIEDDGRGFVREKAAGKGLHLGLQTMRERAESVGGKLDVVTAPGQGTKVIVSLPIG